MSTRSRHRLALPMAAFALLLVLLSPAEAFTTSFKLAAPKQRHTAHPLRARCSHSGAQGRRAGGILPALRAAAIEDSWTKGIGTKGLGLVAASSPLWASVASANAQVAQVPDVLLGACLVAQMASSTVTTDSLIGGMLAGAVAGAAVDLVLYPLDTVKTRLQTLGSINLERSEWRLLYSGLLGGLAGHVPSSALFFAVYETSRVLFLEPQLGIGSVQSQLLASALGNVAASTIRVPTEVVKTRMQSGAETRLAACVGNIVQKDGPSGLFRGYGAFLLRDLPFDAIEFVAYEQLKVAFAAMSGASAASLGGVETALVGALAGGITGALTTPLDTVRARQMNEAGEDDKDYSSIASTINKIVSTQGWEALFTGVVPRSLWLALGGTVFFSSLEAAKKLFMP